MAKISKRRLWAVEFKPPNSETWYAINAYSDEREAVLQAQLARERVTDPDCEIRYRKAVETPKPSNDRSNPP